MSDVLAALNRDHANIEKLLALIESEILAVGAGKTPDYPLLQNIMSYMTQYPARFHHPREDLIFAQVLKHDPGTRADIEALLEEHVSIDLAGRNFVRILRTSKIDSVKVRQKLWTAGFAYIQALREHMSKEEGELFALARAVLTKDDWLAIEEAADALEDPLFGAETAKDYEGLYRMITDS